MADFYIALFSWLPAPLPLVCGGAVTIFFLIGFCHLFAFILDLIPFL